MRTLPSRGSLQKRLLTKLSDETNIIAAASDPKAEAEKRYGNARKTKWFAPVVKALGVLAGPGQRCMLCSGSESSDVEHYRPKAVYPELALTWENYLWSCTPCNRSKGSRFPPDNEPGERFINPLDENVWDFFFIDSYGLLTPRFDPATQLPNARGVTTRELLSLNREAVQECRLMRLKNLRQQVEDTLLLIKQGKLSLKKVRERVATWAHEPWQPDVADYFLKGPGRAESPFKELFAAILS